MSDTFDPREVVLRFRERAESVRRRQLPPVEGDERKDFIRRAKLDHQNLAVVGDADVTLEDGVLTLRVDVRPAALEG